MKFLLDQNMGRPLAALLRNQGFDTCDVHELGLRDSKDEVIWAKAVEMKSALITRDFHFTNRLRYDPSDCGGIVFITPGNLKIGDEYDLVRRFLEETWDESMAGKLVHLSPGRVRVR